MTNIPIFFTFNDDYAVVAAVAFHSLLNTAKKETFYEMFVLHNDISAQNQNLLFNIIDRHGNAKLQFVNTEDFLCKEWAVGNFENNNKHDRRQFTRDAIVRCFAARFFANFKSIIYSDVDVIFMDDISELQNIDFEIYDGKAYIAAVKNPFLKFSSFELSHLSRENYKKFKDSYFAGGIWVLNLDKIRKDNLENKMFEIIKDDGIIKRWSDQDIMNLACDNKVKYLSLRYISYPYMAQLLKNKDFTSHYSRQELTESIENPKILHFAGQKPWNSFPMHWEKWWSIFSELNLPKTAIFKNDKKIKLKYKIYLYIYRWLDGNLSKKELIRRISYD